jgi:hypothetical protein
MLRRVVYLMVALLLLTIMTLPIFAIMLAARGELMIGTDQGSSIRVFMVNTEQETGIGLQRTKESGTDTGCLRTTLNYFLWEGQKAGLNTSFCECYNLETGYADTSRSCENE